MPLLDASFPQLNIVNTHCAPVPRDATGTSESSALWQLCSTSACHMWVTRPQTQPGVVDTFARDLDDAVRYALKPARDVPATGAVYGGAPKGVPEIQQMISDFMVGFLDASQDVPHDRG